MHFVLSRRHTLHEVFLAFSDASQGIPILSHRLHAPPFGIPPKSHFALTFLQEAQAVIMRFDTSDDDDDDKLDDDDDDCSNMCSGKLRGSCEL